MDGSQSPFRMQFRFWLDVTRDEEFAVAEYVNELKRKRKFAQTIREAFSLIRDLRNGSLRVLLMLFPWVYEQIAAEVQTEIDATRRAVDESQQSLQAQLARLETLLLQQGALPINSGRPSQAPVPPLIAAPARDDDPEIEVQIKRPDPENNNISYNFAISQALLTKDVATLPEAILAYGIRTGRLPAHMLPQKAAPPSAPKPTVGNAKKMDVPQFAPPSFDDDDDDLDLLQVVSAG